MRDWNETQQTVLNHISQAGFKGNIGHVNANMTQTGVKDKIARPFISKLCQFEKSNPTQEEVSARLNSFGPLERLQNPFFRMVSFDGHKDTPIEILHTLLLGVLEVQYI